MYSLKGAPGTTTFALALAASWREEERPVVIEADPAGGDVAMRHGLAAMPGLVSLAAAARRASDPRVLWQHVQVLPGGTGVVVAPPDPERARSALAELAPQVAGRPSVLRAAADLPGAVLIVDCGRVDAGSAVRPIIADADVTAVLVGSGADGLAHFAVRSREIRGWSSRPPLLLLAGRGYSAAEVETELGVRACGRVPSDEAAAAALSGRLSGRPGRRGHVGMSLRKVPRSGLGRFAGQFGDFLIDLHDPPGTRPIDHRAGGWEEPGGEAESGDGDAAEWWPPGAVS